MASVFQEWKSYRQRVIPATCSAVQDEESRRAFYAGAFAMFTLITTLNEGSEDADVARLQGLRNEVMEFVAKVEGGQ